MKVVLTYAERNEVLRGMGFASYADYLKSDLWKSIRNRVFRKCGRECYLCGKPASQIHHNNYTVKNLAGKKLGYMYPVCSPCHEGIEFQNGSKAPIRAVNVKFRKRRAKQRKG